MHVDRIRSKARTLHTHPDSGRIVKEIEKDSIRELIEGNYRIIYQKISQDNIRILTIHHSARKLKSKI